ncbi:MAG: DUF4383 domain-containing protein [Pseudonocardiaceae bacterium]
MSSAVDVEWKGMDMAFATPEQKFGIPVQSRGRPPRTLEQNASMILGSIYMGGGILGFIGTGLGTITGFSPDTFLGFPLNVYHNIVHIGIAAVWFLGAFALTAAGNEGVNIAIGGIYSLATVIGFLGYLPLLNIHAGNDVDNYLHLVTALATLIFGTGILRVMSGRQLANA